MDRIYFDREKRIALLGDLYRDASQLVVVDDVDLSHLNRWDHYFSWDFMPAARSGEIVSELPPAESSMTKASHYATPYMSDQF